MACAGEVWVIKGVEVEELGIWNACCGEGLGDSSGVLEFGDDSVSEWLSRSNSDGSDSSAASLIRSTTSISSSRSGSRTASIAAAEGTSGHDMRF